MGAGPALRLLMSCVGRTSRVIGVTPRERMRSSNRLAAVRAIASTGWRNVVNPISGEPESGVSSKPITDSCVGTSTPRLTCGLQNA